uniref:Orthodenticle homeobox 1 n=1 Tax=Elaeophora elaphi TaxID=1147741 RepID=A0A0R3S232_9BILA
MNNRMDRMSQECSTSNISRPGGASSMDPKYIPGVKSEGIPLQPQPSTSISTSAVSTATYRDFFVPSAGTTAYQHPMHSFFPGMT